ncbi:FUSC family protein [Ureibacillus sp. FSL E2-3493]|uniref:FUSC family protein n=1 Tax=Ureibacillus sp. FSL E2-3493 TaxID=2921367 RepID=UPI003119E1C2
MGNTINGPSIFKQALTVNKKPFPWLKAFLAGLAAGLPIAVGLLFGSLEYGLLAGLGGFTYLYVFPIPYVQLAKKLAWCILAITLCVFLGTILAPYPIISAIVMGLIGATGLFIFGAFRLIGPSAIFFVLIFAMTTGMPIAPDEAFTRAGLSFLGGLFSWIIAMSGWFFNPHGPERRIVKRSYIQLANFLDAIGTQKENDAQHTVMATLKEASQTLASGYIPCERTNVFNHLFVLNNYANKIFLFAVEHFTDKDGKLPTEFGQSLRNIANIVDSNKFEEIETMMLPHPDHMTEHMAQLFLEINEAKNSLTISKTKLLEQTEISKPSAKRVLLGAFDKNSIIFINSLRFGFFTMLAAIIAYEFDLNRSFWVPLSCVAVMSGATVVATLHRGIQRSFGTIFGIIIASFILAFHPTGYVIAFLVFLLTFITELFIVKNYGLAALFFTPNALIMAEAGSNGHYAFTYFATARLIDVVIGIAIGLIGVWLIGRKSASSRLPHLIAKTIRSQGQVFYALFSGKEIYQIYGKNIEFNKMETNIGNLITVYDTAAGEIPKDKRAIEYYWPIVYSLEELGFLLDKYSKLNSRPTLDDQTMARYLLIFESLANASERKEHVIGKDIPEIKGYQSLLDTMENLQNSLISKL